MNDLTSLINQGTGENARLLGLDFGTKRVGVAISDPTLSFSYPLLTLANDEKFWPNIKKILEEFSVAKLILGYPLRESGEKSASTLRVENFKAELEEQLGIPVVLYDEMYSSKIAMDRILLSQPKRMKRRDKGLIDRNAACVILQDYMDAVQGGGQ